MSDIHDRDAYRPLHSQLRPYYDSSLQHEPDLGDEADNDGYRITWGPSVHSILGGLHFPPPVKKDQHRPDSVTSSSAVGGLGKVKRDSANAGLQSPTRLSANGGVAASCTSSGEQTATGSTVTAGGARSAATRSTSDGAATAAAAANRASASRFSKRRKRYGTSAPCLTGMLEGSSSSSASHLVVDNEEASRMLDALTARLEAKALQHQENAQRQREAALARSESEKENIFADSRRADGSPKKAYQADRHNATAGKGKQKMEDDCDMSQEMASMNLDIAHDGVVADDAGTRRSILSPKDPNAQAEARLVASRSPESRSARQPLSPRPLIRRSISSPQSTSQRNGERSSTAKQAAQTAQAAPPRAAPLPVVYDMSLDNGDSFDVDESMAIDMPQKAMPLFKDLSQQRQTTIMSKSSDQVVALDGTSVVKDSQGEGSDPFATRMQGSQNDVQAQEDDSYWNDDSADMVLIMSQMPIPPPLSSMEASKPQPPAVVQPRRPIEKAVTVAGPAWKGFERRDLRRNHTSSSSSGCESDVVAAKIKQQKKEERNMVSPLKKKRLSVANDGSMPIPPSPHRSAVPRTTPTGNSQPLKLKSTPLPVVGNKRTPHASPSGALPRSSGGFGGQSSGGRSKSTSMLEKGPTRNLKAAFKPPTIIRPEAAAKAKEKVQLAKAERRAASANGLGLSQCKPAPVLELDFELDWPSDGELSF